MITKTRINRTAFKLEKIRVNLERVRNTEFIHLQFHEQKKLAAMEVDLKIMIDSIKQNS